MNDEKIRAAFSKKYLEVFHSDDAILLNEVGVLNGSSIVDIAAITKNSIEGFEIKSAVDSLSRLPRQIKYYNKVFDFVSIITEEKHLEKCKELVPTEWGIILAEEDGNEVKFFQIREPSENIKNDKYSLSLLLWKNEIIFALRNLGFKNIHTMRVFQLRKLLISVPGVNLNKVLYDAIKTRVDWKNSIN